MRSILNSIVMTLAVLTMTGCATPGGNATPRIGPGMNAAGEVVDPKQVQSGYGEKVHGIGDWDGEVTGHAPPDSPFSRLQIGMGMQQAVDIAGMPTDQGAYITGKAFIPFYFGSDRSRYELVYRGLGRLIFAGGSLGDFSGGYLIWIINSAAESGYR